MICRDCNPIPHKTSYTSPRRVLTHQIKLPLSLTIILGLIASGLIANVLKPVLKIDEAFTTGEVHKIAICNSNGTSSAGVSMYGLMVD